MNENYHRALIHMLASAMHPSCYLELGLSVTPVLPDVAQFCNVAYGVDKSATNEIGLANVTVYTMTTDEFFATQTIHAPELVFVDADHRSEQVMKDLRNIEAICADNCIVVIHDTYPKHGYKSDDLCSDSYTVPSRLPWEHVTIPRHPGATIIRMKPVDP